MLYSYEVDGAGACGYKGDGQECAWENGRLGREGRGGMKKALALLVFLAIPYVTAFAASTSSQWFVVRNWKAATPEFTALLLTDPAPALMPAEEIEAEEVEIVEMEEPEGVEEAPVDGQTVPPTTLVFTDEEASVEGPEEPGETAEIEDLGNPPTPVDGHSDEPEVPVEGELEILEEEGVNDHGIEPAEDDL